MPKHKTPTSLGVSRKVRPAMTPEARENQLISMAYDLVEQRLLDGTATSQETTHFLKMGSEKARLENAKLREENELLKAKTEAIRSSERMEELYSNAISAMRDYSGKSYDEDTDDYDKEILDLL